MTFPGLWISQSQNIPEIYIYKHWWCFSNIAVSYKVQSLFQTCTITTWYRQHIHTTISILSYEYPFILFLLPTHVCCFPWSGLVSVLHNTCGRECLAELLQHKKGKLTSHFSCPESCLYDQAMPDHVKGPKNEMSELWIKIFNLSLKSATVLQPCKVTCVPVFQKDPQGSELQTQML